MYKATIINAINPQVANNAAALSKIILLGVTKSCAFHPEISSIGLGITTIWELGMICGQSLFNPDSWKFKRRYQSVICLPLLIEITWNTTRVKLLDFSGKSISHGFMSENAY